jgi:L-alanine-DL-glutamate epimerase-like enolase superfamily enzyme
MKLQRHEMLHCDAGWRKFSFLKLSTADGLTGISEYNESYGSPGLSAVIDGLCTRILGDDPRAHERISAKLYAITRQAPGGIAQQAIAAIENALLDLKGKALGVPVYELLGGPVRTRARTAINTTHCVDSTLARACVAWGRPAHGPSAVVCRYIEPRGHASRMRSMPPPAP